MSSENTLTGRNGEFMVTPGGRVARCTVWDVNPTLAGTTEWGDSQSGGYTNRAGGRWDATFTSEGKYATDDEVFDLFQPGDVLIATLWLADVAGLYWDFPRALNDDFTLMVDIDTEEVIGWTSAWGADGIFYRPGDPAAPARVYPG